METRYAPLQHWHLEVAVVLSFFLGLLLGDPKHWFHPVRVIGELMRELEWRLYPKAGPSVAVFWNGLFLWPCCVGAIGTSVSLFTAGLRGMFFPLGFLFEIPLSYQLLVTRCLQNSAERVVRALGEGGLATRRKTVSYIVGRDVEALDEAGVIRATVETVAENVSDGEMTPLFYLLLFGVTGGWAYKTVNMMDSMPGCKSARYKLFGRVAAHMDDVFNRIPTRITALLLITAAAITGQDAGEAACIFRRDRYWHANPNSAQTESVITGTPGVRLAEPASYFGECKEKPYISDEGREIETEDIVRANRVLTATSWLSLFFFLALRFFCCAIATKLTVSLQGAAVLLPLLS